MSAAYLRILGETQAAVANAVGIGKRTLERWEDSAWWPQAMSQAEERWLSGVVAKARKSLERGVAEDADLALKVLERRDRRLAPPTQRVDQRQIPYDPRDLTDEELERTVAGEPPDQVLAETRGRRRDEDAEA